jgi:glycosyltransferase involved in cell wall biosynthesis
MNVIFVGCHYPKEREEEIRYNSKCDIDNAANNLQFALLEGLDYYYPNLKVITVPAIGLYPLKHKKVYFKKSIFSHKKGAEDICLGFINIPLVKHFTKTINLYRTLKKNISTTEETIIIIYSLHTPFLKAVIDLKQKNGKIKICQIVPDLPQFMSESLNPIYLFLKNLDSKLINKYLKKVDSFVLLSEFMVDKLNIGDKPWVRVEGIFNSVDCLNIHPKKENFKTILYTGNLGYRYGILTLLEAFSLIKDENYRLWIRGNGSAKKSVLQAATSDLRIKYFDEMSKKDLVNIQKRATVLVNPVHSQDEFAKYFFPSKTMDYMASGTPTIMTRINSMPPEYFDHAFVFEMENAEGFKETIISVCSKPQAELDAFGKQATQFILDKKNPIAQVKKIYDLLNEL